MLTLLLLVIFVAVAAVLWFQGLWNNAISLVNTLLAGMIATNFYEPIVKEILKQDNSLTYVFDCVILWALFGISFTFLRLATDLLSHERVKFIMPVEMAGRSILAIMVAWVFLCFATFTIHTAPIQANAFNGAFQTPDSTSFLLFRPGQQWTAFVQTWSAGALQNGGRQFDPDGDVVHKYFQRRRNFEGEAEYSVK
jgi:hypothetical protein